jgi:hypothetical protein
MDCFRCQSLGVVGGISALSLEIRIIRWKFKRSAGKSFFEPEFYFSSVRFVFPAGKFLFQQIF